ncbi:MAG: hypothetical protein H6636_00585 [Anaerolineales bacterium]|nr:hypothetical protein [Anaerolineales bacterium]
MPPLLDVYILTRERNIETLNQFLDLYVDREASMDRGDEELMILPRDCVTAPKEFDEWEWTPALNLKSMIWKGLDYPRRAFTIYLTPAYKNIERVIVAFTQDDQLILGVSIEDEEKSDANLELAKSFLHQLANNFNGIEGFIAWEEPPPILQAEFSSHSQNIYMWRHIEPN